MTQWFWFVWCGGMFVCIVWISVGLWDDWRLRVYRKRHPYLTRKRRG